MRARRPTRAGVSSGKRLLLQRARGPCGAVTSHLSTSTPPRMKSCRQGCQGLEQQHKSKLKRAETLPGHPKRSAIFSVHLRLLRA